MTQMEMERNKTFDEKVFGIHSETPTVGKGFCNIYQRKAEAWRTLFDPAVLPS